MYLALIESDNLRQFSWEFESLCGQEKEKNKRDRNFCVRSLKDVHKRTIHSTNKVRTCSRTNERNNLPVKQLLLSVNAVFPYEKKSKRHQQYCSQIGLICFSN